MKPIVDCQRLQLGRGLMCPFAHSPHARPPPPSFTAHHSARSL